MADRTYNGFVYRQAAPGQPWVKVGPATMGEPDPIKVAGATKARNEAAASAYDPEAAALDNEYKRAQIAEMARRAAAEEANRAPKLTPGQQALDQAFAKEYADWVNAGGSATLSRQIRTLDEQSNKLANSGTITGPIMGRAPNFVRQMINPDSINVQDKVEQTVQSALRQVLGGQFTQQEADRFLARSYNPTADEKDNIARLRDASNELKDKSWAKDDSARYFERRGTLAGYKATPRPKTVGEALKYGEATMRDYIQAQRLAPDQARVAWQRFYADPRVSRLRQPTRNPSSNDGWKIEEMDD